MSTVFQSVKCVRCHLILYRLLVTFSLKSWYNLTWLVLNGAPWSESVESKTNHGVSLSYPNRFWFWQKQRNRINWKFVDAKWRLANPIVVVPAKVGHIPLGQGLMGLRSASRNLFERAQLRDNLMNFRAVNCVGFPITYYMWIFSNTTQSPNGKNVTCWNLNLAKSSIVNNSFYAPPLLQTALLFAHSLAQYLPHRSEHICQGSWIDCTSVMS